MTTLDPAAGLALITDGSANWQDRSGGWAWVALDAFDGVASSSGYVPNSTNNQMELMAPTNGLIELAAEYGPCDVLVYCDSEYVVKGAMHTSRTRAKNKTFWHRLDLAMDAHSTVEFLHVKGHNGHRWNEMADQMAGHARKSKGAK